MSLTAAETAPFAILLDGAEARATEQFRACMVVHAATLSLMIDAGITTPDKAIRSIEETRRKFPDVFDTPGVGTFMQSCIDLVNGRMPLHGSVADQIIQRRDRKRV